MNEARGWHCRGYLPHIDAGAQPQFLTWRLADSIAAALICRWQEELSAQVPAIARKELYNRIEKYLDEGHGSQLLRNPIAAKIVQDAILFYHDKHYQLNAWVVMPTHVHVLLTPFEGKEFRSFLRPLKGYTSRMIRRELPNVDRVWQRDFFDRLIRDEAHFFRVMKYIEWNPVKAGLCTDPSNWPYSSANVVLADRILVTPKV